MTITECLVQLRNDLKTWVINNLKTKVDKEEGKYLSSNDYTTEEKEKLAALDPTVTNTIIDTELSSTSENPVQNKVIYDKFMSLVGNDTVPEQIIEAIDNIDYPVDRVNGKTGDVNLTAEDVGALPDTTEIPSIDGLASVDHIQTIEYGGTGATSSENARVNLEVAHAIEDTEYPGCYYRTDDDGLIYWINPPMVVGVDYRTTEYYMGRPVFIKTIYFDHLEYKGTVSIIDESIADANHIISIIGSPHISSTGLNKADSGGIDINETGIVFTAYNDGQVSVFMNYDPKDYDGYNLYDSAYCTVKYIKNMKV